MLQQITDANLVTKSDVLVYKGKIQKAVEELFRSHNDVVMAADSKKRKAIAEALSPDPASKNKPGTKRDRMTLIDAADMDDEEVSSPPELQNPKHTPPKAPATRAPTPRVPTPPPTTEVIPPRAPSPLRDHTPPPQTDETLVVDMPCSPAPQNSPVVEAEAVPRTKDFSPAHSVQESEANAAEANASLAAEEDVDIMNPSQELALTRAQEVGPSQIIPSPRLPRVRSASRLVPIQDTQLESNYPRETFPIFLGASSSRHGPQFDVELYRSKLRFFGTSPYSSPHSTDDL